MIKMATRSLTLRNLFCRSAAAVQRRHRRQWCSGICSFERLESRSLLTAVVMTDYEQLLLELINRGRADPAAEADRYEIGLNEGIDEGAITTDPKQPLAPNQLLLNAAVGHSQDMIDRDFFSHTNPSGVQFWQRIVNAGYTPYSSVGENIAMVGTTGTLNQVDAVHSSHRNLFRSVKGHREALMNPGYREVGPGVRFGVYTDGADSFNAILVTENFGTKAGNAFLTGVVYTDTDSDGFYSVGEAIRSGTVSATNTTTGVTYSNSIGVSGGYQIAVPNGTYSVTASYSINATQYLAVAQATISGENSKADFETGSVTLVSLNLSAATASVSETGSENSVAVTVTRNGDVGSTVVVNLTNPDTSELSLPMSVTIPAGQTSAVFTVTAVDDQEIDGDVATTLSATTGVYQTGELELTTVDTTVPELPATATESDTARPTFTWTGISNAADYQLWVNNASGTVVLDESGISGTTFTPAVDLNLGTHYAWVRGRTAQGIYSSWSPISTWRVRTRAAVQTAGTIAADDFTIEWNSVAGAAVYDVWINRLTSGTSQYYRNNSVATNSVDVSDFDLGRYAVWVQAQSPAGNGIWSPMAQVTVSVPVAGLQVTATDVTSTPTLSWDAVTGAGSYDVWINNLSTGEDEFLRNSSVAGTSLQLNSLPAGSYRGWVRARDEFGGNYAWSSAFDFEHQRAARPLSPAGTGTAASPVFKWSAVSGATRYELWVSSLDGGGRVIHHEDLVGTAYTATEVLAAGNYRIWLRAFDSAGGTTGWSSALDFSVASQWTQPPSSNSDAADSVLTDAVFADVLDVLGQVDRVAAAPDLHRDAANSEPQSMARTHVVDRKSVLSQAQTFGTPVAVHSDSGIIVAS
jgi:hypothetical protein